MGLIPYVGVIKPTDKIPLRSFQEDLEDFNKKSIDPITGKMFYSSAQSDLSKRYTKPKGLGRETMKYKNRDLKIDQMPVVLNKQQMQWLEAQGYSIQQKKKENRMFVTENDDNKVIDRAQEDSNYLGGEIAYEGITEALNKSLALDDLPDLFINEKAYHNVEKPKK